MGGKVHDILRILCSVELEGMKLINNGRRRIANGGILAVALGVAFVELIQATIGRDFYAFLFTVGTLTILIYVVIGLTHLRTAFKYIALCGYLLSIKSFQLLSGGTPQTGFADHTWSVQLLDLVLQKGHIQGPMGTGRAQTYSYFPTLPIEGSILVQITGVNPDIFSAVIYPMIMTVAITLTYLAMIRAYGSSGVIELLIFSLNVEFLSVFNAFSYHSIGFLFSLLLVFLSLKLLKSNKRQFVPLYALTVIVLSLTHFASNIMVIGFIVSFLFLMFFPSFRKAWNKMRLGLFVYLVIFIAINVYYLLVPFRSNLTAIANIYFEAAKSPTISVAKFNPYSYNVLEISTILLGYGLFLGLASIGLLFSMLQRPIAAKNLLFQSTCIIFGFGFASIFLMTSRKGDILVRFIGVLSVFSSVFISGLLARIFTKRSRRNSILHSMLWVSILVLLISANLLYSPYRLYDATKGNLSNIRLRSFTEDFLAPYISPSTGTALSYPQNVYEYSLARIYYNFTINDPTGAKALALGFMNITRSDDFDFAIFQEPLSQHYLNFYLPSELHEKWIAYYEGYQDSPIFNMVYNDGYTNLYLRLHHG